MCYTLTTYLTCDDCGGEQPPTTTDKMCPSSANCPERNRRPLRQKERVSRRICPKCEPYTDRQYHSRAPSTGGSRTDTDRIHTIRTNETDVKTDPSRGGRRRRHDSDSDRTIRGDRADRRSKDTTDYESRRRNRRRHDSASSMTESFSNLDTSDSDRDEGFFRYARDIPFRPLESDRSTDAPYRKGSTYSDSTYRSSDSTYRGSDSTHRDSGDRWVEDYSYETASARYTIYKRSGARPNRPHDSSSTNRTTGSSASAARPYHYDDDSSYRTTSSSSGYYANVSTRRYTNIQSSGTSRNNIIPLRNVLRQYGLVHSDISKMYKDCKGPTLSLPRSFDEEYPRAELFKTETGEFYVNLHSNR